MISKKINIILFWISMLHSVLFINCSLDPVSGNSSGSETINTFTITVAERHGVIKSGASVRLINPDAWFQNVAQDSSPVIYSDSSDSNGNVIIPDEIINSFKTVNLMVDCQNKGICSSIEFNDNIHNDTVYLEQHGGLNGKLNYKGEVPEFVTLMGTDYKASVCFQTLQFSFSGVAPGTYTLISVSKESTKKIGELAETGTEIIIEGEDVDSEYECDFTSLLIDDFEHDGYWSPLSKFQKRAFWYIIKSGDVAVTFPTTREIDTTYVTVRDALVSDGAYEGKSLHLEYMAGSKDFYLIPGLRIGFDNIGFSNIDTISFMAKGNDQLTLRLHGNDILWDKPQALYKVTLDTTWKMYKIPTSHMLIVDPVHAFTSWDIVKSRLYWLTFLVEGDGNSIWIDDVRFNNTTINDLLFPW